MKFSDFDFSALGRMMDNLSDEQKDSINNMAQDMMANMQPAADESVDYTEGLSLSEDYQDLDGNVLNALEAAWDLEDFYSDDPEADLSASVLFLSKALLFEMRKALGPVFGNVLSNPAFQTTALEMTSLQDFLKVLYEEDKMQFLVDEGFGGRGFWQDLKNLVQSAYGLESKALFSTISAVELDNFKQQLIDSNWLLRLNSEL